MRTRSARFLVAALLASLGASGCGDSSGSASGDFISDVYGQSTGDRGGADAGAAAPDDPGLDGGEDPERAIAEADIIQIDGDRLYALSRFAGLTVIDLSNPRDLRVLGTHRFSAIPFEMYLREGVAYVMYNGFWSYEVDAETGNGSWNTTARMQALDVADPTNIEVLADQELLGEVSDSRMVGDVIYVATFENGYCWGCDTQPKTRVASFSVSPSGYALIDQVEMVAGADWGPQSISVTTERIYVASNDWSRGWEPGSSDDTRLFTIDISDPSGEMTIGATVEVHGRIQSRWQMDEHEGVLRVISQAGGWGSGQEPVLETFTVASSSDITPLASLTMRLPRPESLQSARFDGDRAYAITFEQIDPLFTFDLSDPANPLQVGELEIPGWVYHMEPRGDRVYGLGFDEGAMTVSIFDVSDMTAPTMLDRVHFGGDWSWAVEDQDRIHKAFNLLLDRGLILVPFAGAGTTDDAGCRWEYESGIQIIDVAGDDLTLRGVAPQIGTARRSILRADTLFGVSDHAVQSFDITDRDAPSALDTLELARHATSVHAISDDEVLRFGNDWWTGRTTIDLADAENASVAEPVASLDLTEVEADDGACESYATWGDTVYPHGDYVYVPHHRYDYRSGRTETTLRFHVVDMRGEQPTVVGHVDTEPSTSTSDGYEYFGEVLKTDRALVVSRVRGTYSYDPEEGSVGEQRVRYDVFSLEDPAAPTFTTRFELPADIARGGWGYFPWGCAIDYGYGWWYGGGANAGLVSGDVVASQHAELVRDGSGRVRYYLDRLDLSDPASPRMLAPVNIPGQVVHYDHRRNVVVTLEDVLQDERASDWETCRVSSGRVSFDWEENVCRTWDRRINTLRLDGEVARLVSRESLDRDGFFGTTVAVSASRVFVRSQSGSLYGWDSTVPETRVTVFALRDDATLDARPSVPLEVGTGYYWWWGGAGLTARGDHAFISESNRLTVIDASGRGQPTVREVDMPGWHCQSLEVRNQRAFCAMGPYGVLTIDL